MLVHFSQKRSVADRFVHKSTSTTRGQKTVTFSDRPGSYFEPQNRIRIAVCWSVSGQRPQKVLSFAYNVILRVVQ